VRVTNERGDEELLRIDRLGERKGTVPGLGNRKKVQEPHGTQNRLGAYVCATRRAPELPGFCVRLKRWPLVRDIAGKEQRGITTAEQLR
jgi:hypothetical protein